MKISNFKFQIKRGFTLIELLVVISIIGVIAGFLLVSLGGVQKAARDSQRKAQIAQYQQALETVANAQGGVYPVTTASISASFCNTYLGSSISGCPQDPRSADDATFVYSYSSDGARYVVWAKLENSTDYWVTCSDGQKGYVVQTTAISGGACPQVSQLASAGTGGAGTTTAPTTAPTSAPTSAPTTAPTTAPTLAPTAAPTAPPTVAPTIAPTTAPTVCGATTTAQKRVFVTSRTYTGAELGGWSGADRKCQARADAVPLGGTWKAWISDSTNSVNTRFTRSSGNYVDIQGTVIASGWCDLTDGTLGMAFYLDEFGTDLNLASVWTNTLYDGNPISLSDNSHCQNWTSTSAIGTIGRVGVTNSTWSGAAGNSQRCNSNFRVGLYCFEQ